MFEAGNARAGEMVNNTASGGGAFEQYGRNWETIGNGEGNCKDASSCKARTLQFSGRNPVPESLETIRNGTGAQEWCFCYNRTSSGNQL